MQKFLGALAESGYLMPLIASVEAVVGILLSTDRFVPLDRKFMIYKRPEKSS